MLKEGNGLQNDSSSEFGQGPQLETVCPIRTPELPALHVSPAPNKWGALKIVLNKGQSAHDDQFCNEPRQSLSQLDKQLPTPSELPDPLSKQLGELGRPQLGWHS